VIRLLRYLANIDPNLLHPKQQILFSIIGSSECCHQKTFDLEIRACSGPFRLRLGSRQQLHKAEIIALELRIFHLAVAGEIYPIEAETKPLHLTIRELRCELRKHRLL
jgi:hypothetical protein